MSRKKTIFKQSWLLDPELSWLKAVKEDNNTAFCELCRNKFSLSNMGKQAIKSHMSGTKHKTAQVCNSSSQSLKAFFCSSTPRVDSSPNASTENRPSCSTSFSMPQTSLVPTSVELPSTSIVDHKTFEHTSPKGINKFLILEQVTEAEITWCMQTVMLHNSLRGASACVPLFTKMFPDSAIASRLQLQRTKMGYVILYGLAPYFHNELLKVCLECNHLVVGFDESLNKVTQKGQMDISVRFWNTETNQVCFRYFSSAFLGHSTANDLLQSFTEVFSGINMQKILQISMDGPNVNFKFLREFKDAVSSEPSSPVLLDIGSCGLHSVHCAFKAAVKATQWDVVEFLRALYYLFKNVPARRADYCHYSSSSLFPLKFCAIRWLENVRVAERAAAMLPGVREYVKHVNMEKKAPTCQSFKIVSKAVKDHLLEAKLALFQTVARELEGFLARFQSDAPLAPLLYESLCTIIKNIMTRFVKPDILQGKSLTKVDLSSNSLLPAKLIDIGFATQDALRRAKMVSEADLLKFKADCRICFQKLCIKLLERSPLKFQLTKGISCLDPSVCLQPTIRNKRLESTLKVLVQNNWMSGATADSIQREFKAVCNLQHFKNLMSDFTKHGGRLDTLWMAAVPDDKNYENLIIFLKLVLVLSHGNASLERGFSINKECLVENQRDVSLIAIRQVYDAVLAAGGVEKVSITKGLVHSVRNARSRYSEALNKQKADKKVEQHAEREKKRRQDIVKELENKKKKLLEETNNEISLIEEEIKALGPN